MSRHIKRLISAIKILLCLCAALIVATAIVLFAIDVKPVVCVSGSMEPAIHTGSLLFIDSNYNDYKERDIIAFENNGMLITHRIADVTEHGFVTKGDANDTVDLAEVTKENVRGRVVMWIPKLGFAIKSLAGVSGIIICATLFTVLFLVDSLLDSLAIPSAKKEQS